MSGDHFCRHSDLQARLTRYVQSHADDAHWLLGLEKGVPVRVEIDPAASQVQIRTSADEAVIHVSPSDGQKVLAYSLACQWANGVVIIPTLAKLTEAGAFNGLAVGDEAAMVDFAKRHKTDPEANLGLLWGALNLLALQGWVRLSGGDRAMRYSLTETGACAVGYVQKHAPLFRRLFEATSLLQFGHALCHRQRKDPDAVAAYASLVEASENDWGLTAGSDALSRRVLAHLTVMMDGFLAGPTWVALDMPAFEKRDDKLVKTSPSIFESFGDDSSWGERSSSRPESDPAFLDAAWRLMRRLGQVEFDATGERLRLTEWGRLVRPIAAPLAALPASYLRSYARLDDLLFGSPDPLGVGQDNHIDRVMNVYGSSGAGSGPAFRVISEKIVHALFDETPLHLQPAGIADMGCGDGRALKRLASYILEHTSRGRRLAERPLLVVGADYNEVARARTRATLSDLEGKAGVEVRVVHADITQPDRYDEAVKASGLTVRDPDGTTRPAGLRDFLHTFMFLVHNRRLVIRDKEAAERILLARLDRVDPALLREAAGLGHGETLDVAKNLEPSPSLDALKAAFRVAYSDEAGIVPGFVAAADLVDFMERWKPFIKHGFLSVEGHSPWAENMIEDVPADAEAWMRVEQSPHPFNWGMHFLSRQFMAPFDEYLLALTMAGFAPQGKIHGRLLPESFPGLDALPSYRFFSIANYVPIDNASSPPR